MEINIERKASAKALILTQSQAILHTMGNMCSMFAITKKPVGTGMWMLGGGGACAVLMPHTSLREMVLALSWFLIDPSLPALPRETLMLSWYPSTSIHALLANQGD